MTTERKLGTLEKMIYLLIGFNQAIRSDLMC